MQFTEEIKRELAQRELARRNLLDQTRYLFKYHYNLPFLEGWHHGYLSEYLMALFSGECHFLIVNMPPSYGKTELCVRQFAPYCLGQDSKTKIIYTSYSDELSTKVSAETRDIIKSKAFSHLHSLKIDATQDQKHHWKTKSNGLFFATSTGGTVTGVHANILIIDDPLKVSESVFKSSRDESYRYFSESLMSRLLNNGKILIIMQRLHPDDLVGRLLKELPSDSYTHICLKAIESVPRFYQIRDFTYERKANEPLCEAWQDSKTLEERRIKMGENTFKTQYLQDPEISEAGFFEKGKESYISEFDVPDQNIYIFIDPAMSLKEGSDERAIVVTGWSVDTEDRELCIVYDCDAGIWDLQDFIEHCLHMLVRYPEAQMLIESDGGGILLYQTLLPAIAKYNATLSHTKRQPIGNRITTFACPRKVCKNQRIIAMHSYFEIGQLKFKKNSGIELLLKELFAFNPDNPNNRDNRIDALSHSFFQRGQNVYPKKAKEQAPYVLKRMKDRAIWNI